MMRTALTALEAAETDQDAFDALVTFGHDLGADLVSYHHIAPPFSRHAENFTVFATGFPAEWVRTYESEKLHHVDPITSVAAYQTRPVRWSDIGRKTYLNDDQKAYITRLYDWRSPGDGLAIPAFGPSGRHGYIGIGNSRKMEDWDMVQQRGVQAVCESFHLRICEIRIRAIEKDFNLTDRQMLILEAMSRGQPDLLICGIVNLPPEKLKTAIKSLLTTMGVTDRPSAILRGKAVGILNEDS